MLFQVQENPKLGEMSSFPPPDQGFAVLNGLSIHAREFRDAADESVNC